MTSNDFVLRGFQVHMDERTTEAARLSRRRFVSLAATGLTAAAAGSLLSACQQPAPAAQPTAASKPVATAGAVSATTPAAAAAGTAPAVAKPTGEAINVGVIQPLTGAVAADGDFVRKGAEIARDAINDKGGVLDRPLQLLVEDNKSDPKESVSAAEKLIVSDKVPCIMGCWGSSMTLAVMPKMEQYSVPLLVETSGADSITTGGNPWVFRIAPSVSGEAAGFAKYYQNFGIKKAEFLGVNTDWGRTANKSYGELVTKNGGTIGAVEVMDQDATDMGAQITKVKQSGGDHFFLTTDVGQIVLVLKQAQERQLSTSVITTGGSNAPDQVIQQAGAAANDSHHILFFMPWFPEAMPDPKLAQGFIDEWRKRGHPESGLTEGFRGHDGILTLAQAIKSAGKPDPVAIRDALWGVNLMGVNGPIKFEKEGPAGMESGQSAASVFVVQIKDGKVTLPAFAKKS